MKRVLTLVVLAAAVPLAAQQISFEQVVAQLKAPEASARLSALQMLEASGYPEAGGPIAALLSDPDERLQRAAVYTELGLFLGTRIQIRRHVALVVEVREAQPAFRAFNRPPWSTLPVAPVPREVVAGMLKPIGHPDTGFRIESIYTLGILGQVDGTAPPAGVGQVAIALAERLADPSPFVRVAAARAGGRMFWRCAAPCEVDGLSRLGDALVHTLNDPDRDVRRAALEGLGDLRWSRAVQAITSAYDYYRKGDEALAYLVPLARIGYAGSVPVFRAAVGRPDDDFRWAGAEGLARVGGAEAAWAAQALAGTKSKVLQATAAFAEVRSGQAAAIARIVQAVDVPATREQAQRYLVELGQSSARPAAAALGSAGPEARVALLEVLSAIGGPAELPVVEPLQADHDARVAAAAERAALRIKARPKS